MVVPTPLHAVPVEQVGSVVIAMIRDINSI